MNSHLRFKDIQDNWTAVVWPKKTTVDDVIVWKFLFNYPGDYHMESYSEYVYFREEELALAFMLKFGFKKAQPHPQWPFND